MNITGRKPKPTALKDAQGTLRADRINLREPKPTKKLGEPPGHLSEVAVEEWRRIEGSLKGAGIATALDAAALGAYCQAYSRWVSAEQALEKMKNDAGGLLVKTTNGNMIQNPIVGVANKAMSDMVRYAAEFGMTPSSRSRISAEEDDTEDPAGEFLN